MNRFRENFKNVNFGFSLVLGIKRVLLENPKQLLKIHFLMPVIKYYLRKNLMNRFRDEFKNNYSRPKNAPFTPFWA